jgi:hypothetical protein
MGERVNEHEMRPEGEGILGPEAKAFVQEAIQAGLEAYTKGALKTAVAEVHAETAKRPWESKTLWVNVIIALSALFPPVQALIVASPEAAALAVSGVNLLLRSATHGKIALK